MENARSKENSLIMVDSKGENEAPKGISSFLNSKFLSDCTLKSESGTEHPCHKVIIAAASGYYHQLFTTGSSPATDTKKNRRGQKKKAKLRVKRKRMKVKRRRKRKKPRAKGEMHLRNRQQLLEECLKSQNPFLQSSTLA